MNALVRVPLYQVFIAYRACPWLSVKWQAYREKLLRLGGELLPEPDFNSADVQDGDVFLLCSDGFWQAVPTDEMLTTFDQCPSEQDSAKYLVDLAWQRSGNRCDNISLVVAQWQDSTPQKYWQRLRLMLSPA